MKFVLILMVSCLFLTCNQNDSSQVITNKQGEQFQVIDFTELNQKISERPELAPADIMKLFYPNEVESGEGNESITIDEALLVSGDREVQLVHDNLLDDSVKAMKYIMHLKKQKNHWEIILLKKNWQCREGRGDSNWGINPCT